MARIADHIILRIVFIVDLVQGILREVIVLFGSLDDSLNRQTELIFAVCFPMFIFFFLITVLSVYICFFYCSEQKSIPHLISGFLQFCGVLLYFIGSNIVYIYVTYGNTLECTKDCQDNAQYVSLIILTMAILFYSVIPAELQAIKVKKRSLFIPNMIVTAIKVAVLYKTGTVAIEVCSTATVAIASVLLCICTLVGGLLLITHLYIKLYVRDDKDAKLVSADCCAFFWIGYLISLLVSIFFFLPFLLADNALPLQYAFHFECTNDTMLSSFHADECVSYTLSTIPTDVPVIQHGVYYLRCANETMLSDFNSYECIAAVRTDSGIRLFLFSWCLFAYIVYVIITCITASEEEEEEEL